MDLNDLDAPGENLSRPDILGDACSPFPDWMHGRYDAVIALALLEHVYDPAAAVANFRAALRARRAALPLRAVDVALSRADVIWSSRTTSGSAATGSPGCCATSTR